MAKRNFILRRNVHFFRCFPVPELIFHHSFLHCSNFNAIFLQFMCVAVCIVHARLFPTFLFVFHFMCSFYYHAIRIIHGAFFIGASRLFFCQLFKDILHCSIGKWWLPLFSFTMSLCKTISLHLSHWNSFHHQVQQQ